MMNTNGFTVIPQGSMLIANPEPPKKDKPKRRGSCKKKKDKKKKSIFSYWQTVYLTGFISFPMMFIANKLLNLAGAGEVLRWLLVGTL
jgi:hypothetical protein